MSGSTNDDAPTVIGAPNQTSLDRQTSAALTIGKRPTDDADFIARVTAMQAMAGPSVPAAEINALSRYMHPESELLTDSADDADACDEMQSLLFAHRDKLIAAPKLDVVDRMLAESKKADADKVTKRSKILDAAKSRPFEHTDRGNGQRIASMQGDRLRYVRAWKQWLVWDGTRWLRDQRGIETVAAKTMVDAIRADVQHYADVAADRNRTNTERDEAADLVEVLTAWARVSSRRSSIEAAAKLAETEDPIAALPDDFDRDGYLFNVLNGTLDLRTGQLLDHDPANMITRRSPVAFDRTATCPTWDAFLARILPDEGVRTFMHRLAGYAMTGSVVEQVIAFLWGMGGNGKSVFLGTLQHVFGDYGFQAPPGLIMAPKNGADDSLARRQRMTVVGRRMVVVQETEAGKPLNEAQVKALTGGDKISAAALYQAEGEYEATHKLFAAMNHKPVIRGRDRGIWRRIKLVPFTVTIPDSERDPDLADKLRAEAPGILAWMVRGCLDWQRHRLPKVNAIEVSTADYRDAEDSLGGFTETHLDSSDPTAFETLDALYARYSDVWCVKERIAPWTKKAFASALEESGFERKRTKAARFHAGVRLLPLRPPQIGSGDSGDR